MGTVQTKPEIECHGLLTQRRPMTQRLTAESNVFISTENPAQVTHCIIHSLYVDVISVRMALNYLFISAKTL